MVEDNRVIGEMGGVIYPGVPEGLHTLAANYKLFIVSNCQTGYIETFLNLNGFESHFVDFECWGNTGRSKGENLRSVIERNHLANPLMVGDAEGDERAARECEVPFAFVEYGFGQCSTAEYRFKSFLDLLNHLTD